MITAIRSAQIQDGKAQPAVEWALKAASYIRETFGTDTQVMRNVGGQTYQLHWVTNYESLAALEELQARSMVHEGYNAMLAEAGELGLFAIDSIVDSIYQSLP